ncbi:50S ribosomal protein L11 methyltransferase [Bacteroidota bacterium]
MDYLEYAFTGEDLISISDQLIALLSLDGYEGFVESEDTVYAYLPVHLKDELRLKEIVKRIIHATPIGYSCALIPERNWNEEWEKNFQPIVIGTDVHIRASFHSPASHEVRYPVLIDPKMSFGTGHHETTRLMINAMLNLDMKDTTVIDIGCGTGILSVLASMMGAKSVLAVDIDEWAYSNCIENVRLNNCKGIKVTHGTVKDVKNQKCSLLLANINRNILLDELPVYSHLLNKDANLLLSGIRQEDRSAIMEVADRCKLKFIRAIEENEWIALVFRN